MFPLAQGREVHEDQVWLGGVVVALGMFVTAMAIIGTLKLFVG